jgi:hypothetical protein
MRAEYDSEADALSIDLIEARRWDGTEIVDENYCTVALSQGRPANVEPLSPSRHLGLLDRAAEQHGLSTQALRAAAQSALAAPGRTVVLDVLAQA